MLPTTQFLDQLGVAYFPTEALECITELFAVFYFYNEHIRKLIICTIRVPLGSVFRLADRITFDPDRLVETRCNSCPLCLHRRKKAAFTWIKDPGKGKNPRDVESLKWLL